MTFMIIYSTIIHYSPLESNGANHCVSWNSTLLTSPGHLVLRSVENKHVQVLTQMSNDLM